jgi:hypothetical protein
MVYNIQNHWVSGFLDFVYRLWSITFRITGFLDFVYRPEFKTLEYKIFLKPDSFHPSDEKIEAHTLLGPLQGAPRRADTSMVKDYPTFM